LPNRHTQAVQVPVWVESWQLQCCGEPFEVGAAVSWRLTTDSKDFILRALGARAPAWSAALPRLAEVTGSEVSGATFGADGLNVFIDPSVDARPVGPNGVLLRLLVEDHHVGVPDAVVPTPGQVSRIDLVRFGYERDDDHQACRPRAGDAALTEVARADKWPVDEVDGRSFVGYLVQLEVDGES
jgi:hypothetical protein